MCIVVTFALAFLLLHILVVWGSANYYAVTFFFLFRSDSVDTPLTKVCIWFRHVLGWGIKNRTNCTICIETVKVSLCLCNILSMCNIFFFALPSCQISSPLYKVSAEGALTSVEWAVAFLFHHLYSVIISAIIVIITHIPCVIKPCSNSSCLILLQVPQMQACQSKGLNMKPLF